MVPSNQDDWSSTATVTPPPAPPGTPTAPAGTPAQPPHGRGPRRGMTLGIVLVLLGVGLLIAQLLPGARLVTMWPLILVVVGVVEAFTPDREGYWGVERFFDGLVTVAFGLVFLAITLGLVGWSVWMSIFSLWPVLLIAAGLGIIGKASHQSWIRALGSLVVIAALGYAVASVYTGMPIGWGRATGGQPFSAAERIGNVESATIKMNLGLANTTIRSGVDLIDAAGESPFGTPSLRVERSGSNADVTFEMGEGTNVFPDVTGARVDMRLSRHILWDIDISAGASELNADLRSVAVHRLDLKPGVSSCTLRLGEPVRDSSVAEIKAGVSTVNVYVPAGVPVRLETDSGLVAHEVGPEFVRVDGAWETEGFSAAQREGRRVWIIREKSGVGSFSLQTY